MPAGPDDGPPGAFANALAVAAFGSFLNDAPAATAGEFEAWLAAHPELAEHAVDLRELYALSVVARGEHRSLPGDATLMAVARALQSSVDAGADGPASAEVEAQLRALERSASPAGRWVYLGREGEGGMGFVDRVWDGNLGREVARKTVSLPEGADRDRRLRLFLEEVRVLSTLDHPAIVPVHEAGLDDQGRLFFVMKLVRGQDLDEVIADLHGEATVQPERWTLNRVLGHLVAVAQALAYAHSKGVLHRDVKPANIRLGRYGETYVIDWGLARALDDSHDGSTSSGKWVGTPAYMAPERLADGALHEDPRSEVYSLGAVLYHVLSGHAPFFDADAPRDAAGLRARVLSARPRPVRELAPEAPAELAELCERCLAEEPGARPATAEAFAGALQQYLADVSEDRVEARRQASRAQRTFDFLVDVLGEASPDRAQGAEPTVREVVEAAAEKALDALDQEPEDAAQLLVTLTEILVQLERGDVALPLIERALALLGERLPADDPRLLRVRLHHAATLRGIDRVAEAEAAYTSLRVDCERALGFEHEFTLEVISDVLKMMRRDYARLEEVIELARDAWARSCRVHGYAHALSLDFVIYLSNSLRHAGRSQEAADVLADNVDLLVRNYGRGHSSTLLGMTEYANHLDSMGELERARDLFEECAEDYRRVVGAHSSSRFVCMANGAWIDYRLGNLEKAERCLREALDGVERSRRGDSLDVLALAQNLALVLLENDQVEEATRRLGELVARAEDAPHRLDGLLNRLRTNYARALLTGGEVEWAIELLRRCVPELRAAMGDGHDWTVQARELLGRAEAGATG